MGPHSPRRPTRALWVFSQVLTVEIESPHEGLCRSRRHPGPSNPPPTTRCPTPTPQSHRPPSVPTDPGQTAPNPIRSAQAVSTACRDLAAAWPWSHKETKGFQTTPRSHCVYGEQKVLGRATLRE